MIQIRSVLHVDAPWLGPPGLALTTVQYINKDPYAKVLKSDNLMHRLLTGKSRNDHNFITKAPIFEQLAELRNQKRHFMLCDLKPPGAEEDAGLDEPYDLEKMAHLLPEAFDIETPVVDTIASINMSVVCEKRGSPLVFKLTDESLQYLHDVLMFDHKDEKKEKPSTKPSPYFATSRQAFRVRYTDGDGQKIKDFKLTDNTPEARAIAEQSAIEFCELAGVSEAAGPR